jgi:hypothetical protein
MFISKQTTGGKIANALIFLAIATSAVVIGLALVSFKKDPKNPDNLRATLNLGKKK